MRKLSSLFFVYYFLITSCNQLPEGSQKTSFKVWGNCNMCKKTIESSLADLPGMIKANWDKDTKMIEVAFDTTKTSIGEIQQRIAASGYDNDAYKGNDSAYAHLHECCKYERK